MIHINRGNRTPDANWLQRANALTQELINAASAAERNDIIDNHAEIWGELKDFLLEISNEKCWYSESKDSYNHLHVDHFRPKKIAIGIDKKDYGGYWWLAFNWMNYRVCGGVGNVKKKDKFAVRQGKANNPQAVLVDELFFFLDPTEEEDALKLTFNGNGEAVPISNTGWDFQRADYTIKNLNLNFKKLKEARKKLWIQCATLVEEIQGLIEENNLNPSAFRRGQIKEKLKQLKVMADHTSAFSATARACLRSTGFKWALECAA